MNNMKKVVVGAVAVLALAACSSSGDDAASTSTPTSTSSTSTTVKPAAAEYDKELPEFKKPSDFFLSNKYNDLFDSDCVKGGQFDDEPDNEDGARVVYGICWMDEYGEQVTLTVYNDATQIPVDVCDEEVTGGDYFCVVGKGYTLSAHTQDALDEIVARLKEKDSPATSDAPSTSTSASSSTSSTTKAPEPVEPTQEPTAAPEPTQTETEPVEEYTGKPRNAEEWTAWCTDPEVTQEDKDIHCPFEAPDTVETAPPAVTDECAVEDCYNPANSLPQTDEEMERYCNAPDTTDEMRDGICWPAGENPNDIE